ncbi:MAG: hypothetical protein QNK54_00935 [Candidatus Planktophila sp.]|jgi:hypothetical protein
MAKQSPAKAKKLRAEAMRAAAQRRAEKATSNSSLTSSMANPDPYSEVESQWIELGLGAPACRALIDDGLFALSDLRKVSLDAIKELHGIGPNAIRILVSEMKKADLSFRN